MATSGVDFKPAFQVEKLNGPFYRMVMVIEEDVRKVGPLGNKEIITRKLVPKKQEFADGYMVYFPQGHSLFVAGDDEEQLQRIGVMEQPKIVDMNSGEEVPNDIALTPKEIVARSSQKTRGRSVGGLTEIMEGEL